VNVVCAPIKAIVSRGIAQQYDLIVSLGLFDYLDQATARKLSDNLFRAVAPGGELIIANILASELPESWFFRERMMDWHLISRSADELTDLAADIECSVAIELEEDDALGVLRMGRID
jgi:hypothetical protein